MKSINLEHPLPASAIELLLLLVDTAEQYQSQTVTCREVWVRNEASSLHHNKQLTPQTDPLGTLQKVGLVERLSKRQIRLCTEAFKRAKYERQNWLGKFLTRLLKS